MQPILVPFIFAIFLYLIMLPIIEWQIRVLRLPKSVATAIGFILTIIVLISAFVFVGSSGRNVIADSERYQIKILDAIDELSTFAETRHIPLDFNLLKEEMTHIPVVKLATNVTREVFSFIGSILLVFIFTLFLFISKRVPSDTPWIDSDIQRSITRYLVVKLTISVLSGIIMGSVLMAFNVPFFVLFGTCAFLLNFIPSIGPIIAGLLPLPIVLMEFGFGAKLLVIILITTSAKFIIGNILEPKVMGDNLGIHPVVILLSLFFWGFIWGLPGMFLSVPLTAIIKILCTRNERFKPIARAIEGRLK